MCFLTGQSGETSLLVGSDTGTEGEVSVDTATEQVVIPCSIGIRMRTNQTNGFYISSGTSPAEQLVDHFAKDFLLGMFLKF